MSPQLVAILAAIFAEQTRVVAMNSENSVRLEAGQALAYSSTHFYASADQLERLSIEARNCQ
jgi:hypothetical protein